MMMMMMMLTMGHFAAFFCQDHIQNLENVLVVAAAAVVAVVVDDGGPNDGSPCNFPSAKTRPKTSYTYVNFRLLLLMMMMLTIGHLAAFFCQDQIQNLQNVLVVVVAVVAVVVDNDGANDRSPCSFPSAKTRPKTSYTYVKFRLLLLLLMMMVLTMGYHAAFLLPRPDPKRHAPILRSDC